MNKIHCKIFCIEVAKTLITGVCMVGANVITKVVCQSYLLSQISTLSLFSRACLTTLRTSGAAMGLCAEIALLVDLVVDEVVQKILKACNKKENSTAQTIGYLAKRSITILAVVGIALFLGTGPLVPFITIAVLIAKDILERACCQKKSLTPDKDPKTSYE